MDYTPTGITLGRVWFDAGANAQDAIRLICERCNYRFWFTAEGMPCFKPAPAIGPVKYTFNSFGELQGLTEAQDLSQIKNRVTIEGAEQDIFNVSKSRVSSKLKGEASDATSIATYLEADHNIDNQLFEDQGSIDDMCASLLASEKDPKTFSTLTLFANVAPLAVGDTIRFRVVL
jgi:hypothetical protein